MSARRVTPAAPRKTARPAATRSGPSGRHAALPVVDGSHRLKSPAGTVVHVDSDDTAQALVARGFAKS